MASNRKSSNQNDFDDELFERAIDECISELFDGKELDASRSSSFLQFLDKLTLSSIHRDHGPLPAYNCIREKAPDDSVPCSEKEEVTELPSQSKALNKSGLDSDAYMFLLLQEDRLMEVWGDTVLSETLDKYLKMSDSELSKLLELQQECISFSKARRKEFDTFVQSLGCDPWIAADKKNEPNEQDGWRKAQPGTFFRVNNKEKIISIRVIQEIACSLSDFMFVSNEPVSAKYWFKELKGDPTVIHSFRRGTRVTKLYVSVFGGLIKVCVCLYCL
eukprot:GHVR01015052.1.p1 GENE.GHVR01015052.1~~GHVR01015052.1.p1  ORF type:complete len:275 (+),score=34.85 GHVR01015052.1:939-1763(+)